MRLPIQYALSFPERWPSSLPRLDVTKLSALHFEAPDQERFPCLRLACEAARTGGTACVALNGANDEVVHAFLDGRLAFGDIPRVIAQILEQHTPVAHPTLDDILAVDAWARRSTQDLLCQCLPR